MYHEFVKMVDLREREVPRPLAHTFYEEMIDAWDNPEDGDLLCAFEEAMWFRNGMRVCEVDDSDECISKPAASDPDFNCKSLEIRLPKEGGCIYAPYRDSLAYLGSVLVTKESQDEMSYYGLRQVLPPGEPNPDYVLRMNCQFFCPGTTFMETSEDLAGWILSVPRLSGETFEEGFDYVKKFYGDAPPGAAFDPTPEMRSVLRLAVSKIY